MFTVGKNAIYHRKLPLNDSETNCDCEGRIGKEGSGLSLALAMSMHALASKKDEILFFYNHN